MTYTVADLSVTRSGRTLLYPISLRFSVRDKIGLVGASGSGKSTLGYALIDELQSQGRHVAHVPQSLDEALDPLRSMAFQWREAEHALGLKPGSSAHGLSSEHKTLFSALKIKDADLQKRPWSWSRGMQQRFVIAMALIGAPDVIILDEPTSALDPVVATGTMDLLDHYLVDRQTAMILITHDLGLAARRVSKLMVMDAGKLVEQGMTEDVLRSPQTDAAKALVMSQSWLTVSC